MSNAHKDLHTLLGVEVVDYQLIDTIGKASRPYKQVIGQQLAEVYPDAVAKVRASIPDIYQYATIEDGWVHLDAELEVGERIKVIGIHMTGVYEIEAIRPGAFRLKDGPSEEHVFVYGREVDDFHAVDYTAISMLNVSATQELYNQVKSQQDEIEALRAENEALKAEFEDIKALMLIIKEQGVSSLHK